MITLCDMTFSDVQRHKLVHLLREVGPDAPTLCEGWTTLDLIIHLVIRENYPLAAAGMMVPQLSAKLAAQTQQLKATVPYTELVDRWERGSRLWPVAKADRWLDTVEHFVHYEDVSRAQPEKADQPQHVDRADEQALLRGLKSMSKMLLRSSTVPVVVPVAVATAADRRRPNSTDSALVGANLGSHAPGVQTSLRMIARKFPS